MSEALSLGNLTYMHTDTYMTTLFDVYIDIRNRQVVT